MEHELAPEEAFAQLGNDTRIGIIRVLGEEDELTFSALRERVGVRDSGQFNYHLNRLVGTFVKRTEDDRYTLSYAGHRVVGAILAGEFSHRDETDTFTLESSCIECDSPFEATYEDERIQIRCPECDEFLTGFSFPPGAFEDRDIADLTDTFAKWIIGVLQLITRGICFNCTGKTTGRLTDEPNEYHEESSVYVAYDCARCNDGLTMSVSSYLVLQPPGTAFLYDHGIDISEEAGWNLQILREEQLEVLSEDPLRVSATLEVDDDRLVAVVDEDLTITYE